MAHALPAIEASIDDEQQFFDLARAAREASREIRSSAWKQAGNSKDRARLKANADADDTLGSPDDPVALLRLDTEDGDCLYVGTHAIADERSDRLVHSWRAPAILRLRGATHDDPRGVARRRTYTTEPVNQVVDLEDLVLAELARQVAELGSSTAEVLQADEFLQSALSRGRTPEMATIIQTIQAAQNDVIAAPADQLLVIQGGPGTGKTAIALHRVAALLYGPLRERAGSEVLVVGPHPTFLRYIARVLPELGEDRVRQVDIGRMMAASVSVSVGERPEAARLKGDERMVEVLARGLSDRVRVPTEPLVIGLEDVSMRVTIAASAVEEILSEIERLPYAVGRGEFRQALEQRVFREARRMQRRDVWVSSRERLVVRAQELENAVERVWPQLSPAAFLRDLFGSVERLLSAAGSILTADEVRLLRRQAAPRIVDQLWSKEDLPLLDQVAWEMSGDSETFEHIVVDEAQDLSPMRLIALRRRSKAGAMTLVGDIAQSTGHWARSSWDDIVDQLASPLPAETVQLDFGYRVPRGVMDVAAALLPLCAPDIEPPRVIRDIDRAPQWHQVASSEDRFARVVEVVREHSSNGLFVGVICPDSGRPALREAFRSAGTQWNDADKGALTATINVVSPGAAKGLEFDAVVVVDPATIVDAGPHGLRMLYIALTRTTGYLDVVFESGSLPRPLRQFTGSGLEEGESEPEVPAPAPAVDPGTDGSTGLRKMPASSASARRKAADFHASGVLELLQEVAPEHMWSEILTEALRRLDDERDAPEGEATPR